MPEFTKVTTITVQALEDWMIPVNTMPTSKPVNLFVVNISRILLNLAPAAFSMPALIRFIPKRKRPRPPLSVNKIDAVIINLLE